MPTSDIIERVKKVEKSHNALRASTIAEHQIAKERAAEAIRTGDRASYDIHLKIGIRCEDILFFQFGIRADFPLWYVPAEDAVA